MDSRGRVEAELARVEKAFCALKERESVIGARAQSLRTSLEENLNRCADMNKRNAASVRELVDLQVQVVVANATKHARRTVLEEITDEKVQTEQLRADTRSALVRARKSFVDTVMAFANERPLPTESFEQIEQQSWEVLGELSRVHNEAGTLRQQLLHADTLHIDSDIMAEEVSAMNAEAVLAEKDLADATNQLQKDSCAAATKHKRCRDEMEVMQASLALTLDETACLDEELAEIMQREGQLRTHIRHLDHQLTAQTLNRGGGGAGAPSSSQGAAVTLSVPPARGRGRGTKAPSRARGRGGGM